MISQMLGLILAECPGSDMGGLTTARSLGAVPIAGHFRAIDFLLSNMVNSKITNIGVLVRANYQSLINHIGAGSAWDLDRKTSGVWLLPPAIAESPSGSGNMKVDTLSGVMNFLSKNSQPYILLGGLNFISSVDFADVLKSHVKNNAVATLICSDDEAGTADKRKTNIFLKIDKNNIVKDIHFGEEACGGRHVFYHALIIGKEKFVEIIKNFAPAEQADIMRSLLSALTREESVFAYRHAGLAKPIDSAKAYYEFNLDLLNDSVRREFFGGERIVYTKPKDKSAAKYGENACASNSIIADGCQIDGTVRGSVIFEGVTVSSGAVVENSIIMQNCHISENARVENSILDKQVLIGPGKKIVGEPTYPIVIQKRAIV